MVAKFNNKATQIDAPLIARNELIGFKTQAEKELEAEINKRLRYIPKESSLEPSSTEEVEHEPLSLLQDRDCLITSTSKNQIIANALEIVCNELKCQVAAIFLYSKEGTLARAGIKGIDRNGDVINDDWFSTESYEVGKSFTGRAANPAQGSKYGKTQVADDFGQEKLENDDKYLEKLGRLDCAIAVPLNGRNKTYGVLRIINKNDSNSLVFSQESVHLVSFFGGAIAAAISNFHRDTQNNILRYLKDSLIISERTNFDYSKFIRKISNFLVGSETAFNAVIFRFKKSPDEALGESETFNAITDSIKNTEMESEIRSLDQKFTSYILQYFHYYFIENNSETDITINKFISSEWIEKNQLGSCGCFPLIHPHKKEIIGTITLFAGYEYEFHSGVIDFLNNIISTITVIVLREQKKQRTQKRFIELAQQWFNSAGYLSSTTEAVIHPAYQQIIGMGEEAIPLLLMELLKASGRWFWALKAITGENPVPREHLGKTKKMTQDWIDWGVEKGYISLDKIELLMYE